MGSAPGERRHRRSAVPHFVHDANRGRVQSAEFSRVQLVTHEIGFASHYANRVLFLAEGVIHEAGTPDEVLKHPKQARTQAFLASHNEFTF